MLTKSFWTEVREILNKAYSLSSGTISPCLDFLDDDTESYFIDFTFDDKLC